MSEITPRALGSLIERELYDSDNSEGSETRLNAEEAYQYLLYDPKGDEVPGRSQVQSGDVADVIDHVCAELQPMYHVEELVKIKPEGQDDVEQAELESKAINWYFRERCNGLEKLDDAIQDGLLLRNAYLKVWPEDSWQLPHEETFEGTIDQINAELTQAKQRGRVTILSEEVIQEAEHMEIAGIGPDGVTPIRSDMMVSPEMVRVEVLLIEKAREMLVECVPREDMFISTDATGQNMQEPRLVAQRRIMTRNEAIALGISRSEVENLTYTDGAYMATKTARQADGHVRRMASAEKGGDLIEVYEVYYLVDADDDGLAERHKIFYSDGKVLSWEETGEYCDEIVRVVPFASGVPIRVAHRHAGRSMHDKEKPIEDAKRTLLRQGLDNVEMANNRRPLLGPGVNPDDVEETEVGSYIRCTQGIQHYGEAGYTPVFDKTLLGLEYLDKMRRERGGSSVESSTQNVPMNAAAHTVERVMSAGERMVGMIARNFARSLIRSTFVLLHQQLKLAGEQISFESGDDWQTIEPRKWIDRERFSVQLGMTEGEKRRQAAMFDRMIDRQISMMGMGADGVLVDSSGIYQALTDQGNRNGLSDASRYWIDPESDQAKQARAQKDQEKAAQAQASQQMIDMQARMQESVLQANMARAQLTEETKRMADAMKAQQAHLDRLSKYVIEMTKLEAQTGQDIEQGVLIGT